MDAKQPPRRELQGPRPAPLKVRKDSHKIKKPPVAPPQQQPTAAPIQHRPPVIIYAVSPKVIHTNPSEFMSLVQRLTGSSSSSSSSAAAAPSLPAPALHPSASTASPFPYNNYILPGFLSGMAGNSGFSPAARLATIEQGRKETRTETVMMKARENDLMLSQFGIDAGPRLDQIGLSPAGILSLVPSSLPVISRNLFSPLNNNIDQAPGGLGFLHDLSPDFAANRSPTGNNFFATTPGSFFANTPTSNFISMTTPPVMPSPGAYWDLFQHYQDL